MKKSISSTTLAFLLLLLAQGCTSSSNKVKGSKVKNAVKTKATYPLYKFEVRHDRY